MVVTGGGEMRKALVITGVLVLILIAGCAPVVEIVNTRELSQQYGETWNGKHVTDLIAKHTIEMPKDSPYVVLPTTEWETYDPAKHPMPQRLIRIAHGNYWVGLRVDGDGTLSNARVLSKQRK